MLNVLTQQWNENQYEFANAAGDVEQWEYSSVAGSTVYIYIHTGTHIYIKITIMSKYSLLISITHIYFIHYL